MLLSIKFYASYCNEIIIIALSIMAYEISSNSTVCSTGWTKTLCFWCWVRLFFIPPCTIAARRQPPPVSVSNCYEAPVNAGERTYTACERQRAPQSAAERDATATERAMSVPMPSQHRHLNNFIRTDVSCERRREYESVRQPWYHDGKRRTAKGCGVPARFSSRRCYDGFWPKTANV